MRAVVAVVIALFISSGALAYELGNQWGAPGTSGNPSAIPVILTINNPFNTANNGSMDQFAPANLSVTAGALLEFVIVNYDSGVNPPPPQYATASGVVGDCIYVSSSPAGLGPCSHSLPEDQIAHTFTIPILNVNVPVPAATNVTPGSSGAQVIFFVSFASVGSYTWMCMAPCDPTSMQAPGFMSGTVTVT
ncbi:MAG TPA: hypothetical protein VMV28_03885 [Thermoplasmata archaeon]|nr:hypothetical protein [Thermoplasmata archaeon]